jgi:tetratricopeptide (TPR) repeat protein
MRRLLLGVVLGLALAPSPAWAAQTQLPPEQKGDPKPDTDAALGYLKHGRYEDAIRQAKLALGRDERYVPAMLVLAKAYYYERKYELSTSIIDIAKSIDANNAECYNLLGFIALTHDDRISATAAFRKATELNPQYGNAWDNLAAQYLFSKNYDGALQAAEKATELLPSFDKAWLNLGSAYRGKQQYADSLAAYKKALQINSANADAYFNLGILYLDAKQMPNTDTVVKFNTAINYFDQYKTKSGYRLAKDDPADGYIAEARTGADREKKRLERLQKQQQRGEPKPAPAGAAPAHPAAPAAKPSGKIEGK